MPLLNRGTHNTLYESDVWVFDAGSGELTALTDDGVEGGLLDSEGDATLDLAPAWSPDGTEIAFARSFADDGSLDEGTYLYRIPADGSGEAEEIALVSTITLSVYGGVIWPEDDRVYYSVAAPTDDEDNGIWAIDPAGGTPERIARDVAFSVMERSL